MGCGCGCSWTPAEASPRTAFNWALGRVCSGPSAFGSASSYSLFSCLIPGSEDGRLPLLSLSTVENHCRCLCLLLTVPGRACRPKPSPGLPGAAGTRCKSPQGSPLPAAAPDANLTFRRRAAQAAPGRWMALNLFPGAAWGRPGSAVQRGDPGKPSCLPASPRPLLGAPSSATPSLPSATRCSHTLPLCTSRHFL